MAEAGRKIKRSSASLTGGFIVGITMAVLTILVTGELGWAGAAQWGSGLVLGGLMGLWVRVADL